jgi:hypothetical protein
MTGPTPEHQTTPPAQRPSTPAHEAMMVLKGGTPTHAHLRRRLGWLVVSTLVVDVVCSLLAYAVERNAPRSQLHTYGQCLFWTTTQLLTVSSQLVNPVTRSGMWLDVLMEFFGITVIAALAGSFGSFLYRRSVEMAPLHPKLFEVLDRAERAERQRLEHDLDSGAGSAARLPDLNGGNAGGAGSDRASGGPVSGSATPSG